VAFESSVDGSRAREVVLRSTPVIKGYFMVERPHNRKIVEIGDNFVGSHVDSMRSNTKPPPILGHLD